MNNPITSCVQLINYEAYYNKSIRPKIEAIDLYLKENSAPFHLYDVAHILEIEINELTTHMQNLNIDELNPITFFSIVLSSSSEICKLLSRQWRYAKRRHYTPEIVAEIYQLNLHKVQLAFDDLNLSQITNQDLPEVFKRIHLTVF